MKLKNILGQIDLCREESISLQNRFKKLGILNTKTDTYLPSDTQELFELWKEFILLFLKFQKILKKTYYRRLFIFKDYNNLILYRFVLIEYFSLIMKLNLLFWNHEVYIREALKGEFKNNYGYFAKFIYRPNFLQLIHTPRLLLFPFSDRILPKVRKKYLVPSLKIDAKKRVFSDYKNLYFYIKSWKDKILLLWSKLFSTIISKIRFSRRKQSLITQENLKKYLKIAKQGDILLTRWNWNATNIFIPGFWKHMVLFLWKWEELEKKYKIKKLNSNSYYVIESVADGIYIKPIEDIIEKTDYLWVARCLFSNEKMERSIKKALWYIWKSYDYNFNFYSEKALVCSELVLKSYLPKSKTDQGIEIKLNHVAGSLTFPPNNFIDLLIEENKKEIHSLIPIFFIDSLEKTWKNFIVEPEKLLESGFRSRWSFFQD